MPTAVASTERHTFDFLAARGARETLVFVSMLATAAVCTQAAAAQSPRTIDVRPMVGGVAFFGQFDELDADLQERGARSSLENAIGYGLDVGVPFTQRFDVDVRFRYVPTDFSVHNGTQSVGFENELYIGGVGISYMPGRSDGSVKSVFSVGLGGKHYTLFDSASFDWMWNLGAAIEIDTQPLRLRFGLMDFMSFFDESGESKLQNDVMFTTAVVLSPFE